MDEQHSGSVEAELNDQLPEIAVGVFSDQIGPQTEAIIRLRKLLSKEGDRPLNYAFETSLVCQVVELLRSPSTKIQFEAAWVLTNIVAYSDQQTQIVIDADAVPTLIELLSSHDCDVVEQVVWALGNIAGDNPQCRDVVLGAGALQPLLHVIAEASETSILRNATWALSNFCRGKNPQPDWLTMSPALPVLARLIHSLDDEVLVDVCWAISYLCDGGSYSKVQAVIEASIPCRLVQLLAHASTSVQTPALRSVGNITVASDEQTQVIIDCGALPELLSLLSSVKEDIQKEACWVISNITAGTSAQIQAVIDANIIPSLIDVLSSGDFKTQKQACWAISNATSGGLQEPEQIQYLVSQGCIKPLCDLLACSDNEIVEVALYGLENILRVGEMDRESEQMSKSCANQYALLIGEADGMGKLRECQDNDDKDISTKACNILIQYFPEDSFHDDSHIIDPEAYCQRQGWVGKVIVKSSL